MDFHAQLLFGSLYVIVAALFVMVMYLLWDTLEISQKLARKAERREQSRLQQIAARLLSEVALNAVAYDMLPDDDARQEALIRYAAAVKVTVEDTRKVFAQVNQQHVTNQYNAAFNTNYASIPAYHFISIDTLIARSSENRKAYA